jgi:hypothetical protein
MPFKVLSCICLLILTNCASVQREYVDPTFQSEGLKGSVVSLKCVSQTGKPYGLAPQEEREILEDLRRAILATQKNVQIVSGTGGTLGDIKPTYGVEVNVFYDYTERKQKHSRGIQRVNANTGIRVYKTKARVLRNVSVRYTVTHLTSERRVWQASGDTKHSKTYKIILVADLRPELQPNVGPPLSEILRPMTRKACGKLP